MVNKLVLALFASCVLLSSCYEYQGREYFDQRSLSDEYDSDSLIDDILNSYRRDQGHTDKDAAFSRTEEADASHTTSREVISMPGVSPQKHDSYICYGQKVPSDEYYVGFQPNAEMHTAHHMLLFGCELPFEIEKAWSCGEMHPVCKSGSQHILYAWGKNAPPLKLPKDVGFKVGPSTKIKYLVLQVHYGKVDKFVGTNLKDYSGVAMDVTKRKLTLHAGIFILAEGFASIPPHEKKWHLDTGCPYEGQATLYPFAVRVHAHHLSTVVSGYRIRNKKWMLIRKENPQRPQAFYSLDKEMTIRQGDHLEARCTYNTMKKDVSTKIGATMNDEMCNFYIMFFYDSDKYPNEPPGMCRWGGLDDNMKFPKGSDQLDKSQGENETNGDKDKPLYRLIPDWAKEQNFGQISGLAVDNKGFVVVFHRAGRTWDGSTFNNNNTLQGNPGPIKEDTMAMTWGKNMFYMPHGLTVDHASNIWVTDVGSHQVFKFDLIKSKKPLLTLGKAGVPGSDSKHFCKPTDVAVDRSGVLYVADGYCNSRILMFSARGQMLLEINDKTLAKSPGFFSPRSFKIPHSVSLDEEKQELYVADRENGRVLVFGALSGKLLRVISDGFGDTVYAISFKDGNLHGASGPRSPRGFTYDVKNNQLALWAEFSRPHDLAVSKNGHEIFVGEIGPNRLWKFEKN
ncbi:LOW QUALITY PROTEIN: peptidylglycine alpha-amidating monooxygenase-like [Rhopilema esculentum]|uniref:LOW QUALITY PROTEIN: peptidylglycine alpha-amidating monooxygenase-like n=1 Tax=Rhopilema esculentum TaxID=499914 RepID=UPI0031D0F74E